MVKFCLNTPKQ